MTCLCVMSIKFSNLIIFNIKRAQFLKKKQKLINKFNLNKYKTCENEREKERETERREQERGREGET